MLHADSVGQLRSLDRQSCVFCGTQITVVPPVQLLWKLGTLSRTDDNPGIRTQRPAVRQPVSNSLRARSQYLQENLWTTARFRTALSGRRSDRDKQLLSELRQASALALPRCVVSRYATAWAESLEGAVSGHQSWALLCRFRCRKVSTGTPS